jgi:hypothetical protein
LDGRSVGLGTAKGRFMSRTPEALVGAITVPVSRTPAEWMKPGTQARRGSGRTLDLLYSAQGCASGHRVSPREDSNAGWRSARPCSGERSHRSAPDTRVLVRLRPRHQARTRPRSERSNLDNSLASILGRHCFRLQCSAAAGVAISASALPLTRQEPHPWIAR